MLPYEQLPINSLRVLCMYGNPCSYVQNYRQQCREKIPKLTSLDGTRLDIDVTEIELLNGEDDPAQIPNENENNFGEDGGNSLYQCDGTFCGKSIIYGTHFQTCRNNSILDLCLACAYETATKDCGGGSKIRIVVPQSMGNENAFPSDGSLSVTTQSQFLSSLECGVSKARNELKKKREGIAARSCRRIEELKTKRKAFEQRKMDIIANTMGKK